MESHNQNETTTGDITYGECVAMGSYMLEARTVRKKGTLELSLRTDCIEAGDVHNLEWSGTSKQLADKLTKNKYLVLLT